MTQEELEARLQHLGALAARLVGGGLHDIEVMTVDGPGQTLTLYSSEGNVAVCVHLDKDRPVICPDGRLAWT